MAQMKSFFDLMNELSMKSDKKLPNLKEPVKGKKGTSKYMRMKVTNAPYMSDYKKAMNAGFKTDANRKAAFAKMNDAVHSADKRPEKYRKPDGKIGIRMVPIDKEVIKKESVGKTAGDKSYYHLQRAKELAKKDGHDYDKLPKYDRAKPHQDHYHDKAKNEASVLKPTKPTDIIKHAKTLAKNPRDYMMNKKKYLDKARAKVFRMYPKEAINHDDAHRDAQTHSDGSMSVKKIPSMIKKPGDKHLHLHMKSYHKEKDGQDFAKKHGYKVKNYVKTQSGTRMDIHKEETQNEISSYKLGGYLKFAKKDQKKDRTKGMNMAVRKGLGSPGIKKPSTSESVDEATHDPKHVKQAIGIASDPRYKKGNMTGAVKAMNKISKNIDKHPQVAAVLRKQNEMVDPMDLRGRPKKKDPNPESPYGMKHPLHPANIAKKKAKANVKQSNPDKYEPTFKEAKSFQYFDNKDDAHAHAKKHGGRVFVNTGKGNTKVKGKRINTHVVIKREEVEVDEALTMKQRMDKRRIMKRNKARIAIGRKRAKKKMANMKVIKKRSDRQARNEIAKKLMRGIPKRELSPARKRALEKRLESPALKQRIKRLSKRMFKDVRKKEVMRKKG